MIKKERAARTRETLVRAAAQVFAEEGFAAALVSAISRRAGVTAGGLHFHFASKTEIARAVEERAADAVARITDTERSVGHPVRVLVDSTAELMELLAQDVVVRAGFALSADSSHESRVDLRGQWRLWVEELLAAAERGGMLAEGVSSHDAARAVVASTVGLEVLSAAEPEWVAPQTLARIWGLVLPRLLAGEELEED